ncbi:phosphotransferase [Paenibacillus arenilitoris]|uniref:Phosphotransferase n=1 Tax=Paenibacillus arenilitoris TaxID=2772299 RepID=A0A927CJH7_9BACL|nr:phosphotransferase [Paenibacillus arenilitoris]MBD2868605.1 phosphotransferase [Paenibacillus arenilitoris]
MSIEAIIHEIPQLSQDFVSIERLSGGLCNETYKVRTKHDAYVLRVNGKQNEYLNLTRRSEVEVMKKASRIGMSPSVIAGDQPERYVVTAFVEGRMPVQEDLRDPAIRVKIMERLKQIHRMEGNGRQCSPYQLIDGYLRGAERLRVKHPAGLGRFLRLAEEIAHRRGGDKAYNGRFCHNDSFLCNMIYTGSDLQVIDWELSGRGDVFFDLAIIPFSSRFAEAEEKAWLKLYFGHYEDEQYAILQDMKMMNMLREVAWGLLYSGLNKASGAHDFDYYTHAEYALERLEQGLYFL